MICVLEAGLEQKKVFDTIVTVPKATNFVDLTSEVMTRMGFNLTETYAEECK